MNRNGFDGKRKPFKSRLEKPRRGIGDDQPDAAGNQRENLLGALRECHGISVREAEYWIRECEDSVERTFEPESALVRLRLRRGLH